MSCCANFIGLLGVLDWACCRCWQSGRVVGVSRGGVLQVLANGAAHKGEIAIKQVDSTLLRILLGSFACFVGLFCV